MSDQITNCTKEMNESDAIVQWSFSYSVEDSGRTNDFAVVVLASEMTDPTDEAEAKTKANAKASAIKSSWVATPVGDTADVPENVGAVTL